VEQERKVGYQAAWLHDVLEDSADYFYRPIDEEDLLNWGFSKRVVEIVGLLTRNNEVSDSGDYYQRIFIDGTARAVKLADIADNLASWRVALLPPQMREGLDSKYGNALKELMFSSESETWFEERVGRSPQGIKTGLALSESRKVLERYQFMAENDNHVRSFLRNQGGLNTISKLYEQSLVIMNESTWIGKEEIPDVMAALDPYSLDVWYGALFLMHSRAQKHQATELWEQVESLAGFLDQQSRSEALFFKHFGLVPRNADYSHIKFRYQKADKALVKLLERFHLAEQQQDAHLFFESRPLEKYSESDLLDILLLAWHEASARNAHSLVKGAVIEFEHRRDESGDLDASNPEVDSDYDLPAPSPVPNEHPISSKETLEKIYTFYVNGVEADEGIWGCVAKSEEEAFSKAKERGLNDFFLSSIDDVPPESRRDNVMSKLVANPNLGPLWVPMAEAFELCSSGLTYRSATWVVNTLMRANNFSPDNTPYLQAILEYDGSIHVEISGRLAIRNLSDENLELLQFIGWKVPELTQDDPEGNEGLPNPYRLFEVGWGALQVAAFVLETLVTVFEFQEGDFFDFSLRNRAEEIAKLGTLERVKIHDGNPDGTIFRLIQPKQT
jgi:hypothetical protein